MGNDAFQEGCGGGGLDATDGSAPDLESTFDVDSHVIDEDMLDTVQYKDGPELEEDRDFDSFLASLEGWNHSDLENPLSQNNNGAEDFCQANKPQPNGLPDVFPRHDSPSHGFAEVEMHTGQLGTRLSDPSFSFPSPKADNREACGSHMWDASSVSEGALWKQGFDTSTNVLPLGVLDESSPPKKLQSTTFYPHPGTTNYAKKTTNRKQKVHQAILPNPWPNWRPPGLAVVLPSANQLKRDNPGQDEERRTKMAKKFKDSVSQPRLSDKQSTGDRSLRADGATKSASKHLEMPTDACDPDKLLIEGAANQKKAAATRGVGRLSTRKKRESKKGGNNTKKKKEKWLNKIAQEVCFFIFDTNDQAPPKDPAAILRVRRALWILLRDPSIYDWDEEEVISCFTNLYQKKILGFYKIAMYSELFDPKKSTASLIWDSFVEYETKLRELKASFPEMKCFLNHEESLPKDALEAIARVTRALGQFFPKGKVGLWKLDKIRQEFRERYEEEFVGFVKTHVQKGSRFIRNMDPSRIWDLFVKKMHGERITKTMK